MVRDHSKHSVDIHVTAQLQAGFFLSKEEVLNHSAHIASDRQKEVSDSSDRHQENSAVRSRGLSLHAPTLE